MLHREKMHMEGQRATQASHVVVLLWKRQITILPQTKKNIADKLFFPPQHYWTQDRVWSGTCRWDGTRVFPSQVETSILGSGKQLNSTFAHSLPPHLNSIFICFHYTWSTASKLAQNLMKRWPPAGFRKHAASPEAKWPSTKRQSNEFFPGHTEKIWRNKNATTQTKTLRKL